MENKETCAHCGGAIENINYSCGNGWDGNSICNQCGIIEPDINYED